jgi:hypothetical protein
MALQIGDANAVYRDLPGLGTGNIASSVRVLQCLRFFEDGSL